nr:hypothetical protein [uncultured Psychroserpens sp.]
MSYIQHLKFIQKSTSIDLNTLSKGDIIKIEKILKARQQLNNSSNNASASTFLESLDKYQKGLCFLSENPNLLAILSNSMFFKKDKTNVYNTEDEDEIKQFFSVCLEQDLIQCCNLAFSKGQYGIIEALLNYRDFLPETVILLIETKTETKLDYYISIVDEIAEDASVLSKPFMSLVNTLNIDRLNTKSESITATASSYAIRALNRSGLSHFFYVMFHGFSWMGREAKTVQEKIEKREVLKDFRFMSKILIAIFVLFISVIIYKGIEDSKRDQTRQKVEIQKFKKSVYGYLTDYDSTQIHTITNWQKMTSGPLNFSYFKHSSEGNSMSRTVTIVNNSTYELLILPDQDLMTQFGLAQNTYYVKPNDSIQASLLFNRIYIGKQLALFNTSSNNEAINEYHNAYRSKNLPRFLNPISTSGQLIEKRFEFGQSAELLERNDSLLIETNTAFRVDGASYQSFPLINLQ